jgi:hypothetical protein
MGVISFSWGGRVTSSTCRKNSATKTSSGVAMALTPYCIEKSKTDPLAAAVFAIDTLVRRPPGGDDPCMRVEKHAIDSRMCSQQITQPPLPLGSLINAY